MVEKVVKPRCNGDVMLMRFADDFVCCFQYREDEWRFSKVLGKRLGKFELELSVEKTKVIKFTRFETENNNSFTFLGFEYSRAGKPLMTMRTSKQKFQAALAAILSWIKKDRSRLGTAALLTKLKQKLQGHFNYYGVSGNCEMLSQFRWHTCQLVFKWLNRRSQKKSCNWTGFRVMLSYFKVPVPRIIGYWLSVTHTRLASIACPPDNRILVETFALVRSEQY